MISSNHPTDAGATLRAMKFSLDGLQEVAMDLNLLNIAFHLIIAQNDKAPGSKVAEVMTKLNIGCLVTDFSPLRHHRGIIHKSSILLSLNVAQSIKLTPIILFP